MGLVHQVRKICIKPHFRLSKSPQDVSGWVGGKDFVAAEDGMEDAFVIA